MDKWGNFRLFSAIESNGYNSASTFVGGVGQNHMRRKGISEGYNYEKKGLQVNSLWLVVGCQRVISIKNQNYDIKIRSECWILKVRLKIR